MALHPDFPKSPTAILDPNIRWFPADESLREFGQEKLLPPLVFTLRRKVKEWRDCDYEGASETSKVLLKYWFQSEHILPKADGTSFQFEYYFAQREALETIIYLHDVAQVKDKYDMIRFDSTGLVSAGMFQENWRRFLIKMATGSGKTKVLSLAIAWSYFHKMYEEDSDMARNFLLIAPNIIVLDRLKTDFEGLNIFSQDPVIPPNGHEGRNWKDDFQVTVHLQDEVNVVRKVGNIFLTNIHRVYDSDDKDPSFEDEDMTAYFLGKKAVTKTNEQQTDLGLIVREIDELMVLNDEAHHMHDEKMAWFQSIQDIHNKLLQKDKSLSLQIDVTATPKHKNGAIFVQTVTDYPLVEAIYQNIVKHPLVPDAASRGKLIEKKSVKFSERFEDFLHLGYLEWKKTYDEHQKLGKKAVLFVMTDDTKNCDEVANYLETRYPEFMDSTLVIHTNKSGDISEARSGRNKEELEILRGAANKIDVNEYKVIVSVMMLKEGWDVRNVTTIVGLRAYTSASNILPEQTLGRGLRCMYKNDVPEYLSVVGTNAFMDFVESIKSEGVELEKAEMGIGTKPKTPIVLEVDNANTSKDIEELDIEIPILTPRIVREYKNLTELDVKTFLTKKLILKEFSEEEKREILFKHVVKAAGNDGEEIHHKTILDSMTEIDYQSVIGYFTQIIMRELRLISGYDVLYAKVKEFMKYHLFEKEIEFEDLNVIRNLSELEVTKTIIETFKKKINELTIQDKGEAEIKDTIKLSKVRPFIAKDQAFLIPKKSVFNKIIGDSHFELEFASYLEGCDDIISYVKNYFAVHFKIDYRNASGEISNYYPDFIVKKNHKEIYIIETKGLEDLDVPEKMERLKLWVQDINKAQSNLKFDYVFVDQEGFEKYRPKNFEELIAGFGKYK